VSDALNIAANGLLRAERRATDIAGRIVSGGAAPSADRADTGADAGSIAATFPGTVDAGLASDSGAQAANTPLNIAPLSDTLVRDIVDLVATEQVFAANANAFRRIDDTLDSLIGTQVDEES